MTDARSIGGILASYGRRKRPGDPDAPTDEVRANSYDVEDPRAQPWRRVGDGSKAQGHAFVRALIDAAREERKRQSTRPAGKRLTCQDVTVLESILHFLDFATGQLTAALITIADRAGLKKSCVSRSILRLEANGFLAHVRRSVKVGGEGGPPGPRRKQASNAYFFDCRRAMATDVYRSLQRKLLARLAAAVGAMKRKRAAALMPLTFNERAIAAPSAKKSALSVALASLEAAILARDAREASASPL